LRAQKTLLSALGSPTPATSQASPQQPTTLSTTPISQSTEAATWDGSTDANFLYYADQFEDGRTANGDIFKHAGFSGARCNIPLGTLAQIRFGETSTTVKLNDRPNCTRHPDIIDLTRTAFSTLAPLSRGKIAGSFTSLGVLPSGVTKQYLPTDFFSPLGINLAPNTPNLYALGETLVIKGQTINGLSESLIYLVEPSGNIISYGQSGSSIEYQIPLTQVGEYELVVAAGRSFSGAKSLRIEVLDPSITSKRQFFARAPSVATPLTTERREAADLTPSFILRTPNAPINTEKKLTIKTATREYSAQSMGEIALSEQELSRFTAGEVAQVRVGIRNSSTSYSLDTYSLEGEAYNERVTLAPLYTEERSVATRISVSGSRMTVALPSNTVGNIHASAYIITPSGSVDTVPFENSAKSAAEVLLTPWKASFNYTMKEPGVYLVEVNYDTGFAASITPVTYGATLAILPNVLDTIDRKVESSAAGVAESNRAAINALRTRAGAWLLASDATLTRLAQAKADDMAAGNYVGHTDSRGESIVGLAKRLQMTIKWGIGENVAGGTVSIAYLQAGLSLSGGHRANMLKPEWTKVGIGLTIRGGKTTLVQVFGE
jgi:uncharacterized protein YkwD